ncbi:MAG: hypothetical protein ABSG31_07140 [Tepidisphaeraceae bacterium]|jgi:hypothetical protein
MSAKLICPDCGGIVGATEATEDGSPCTCFQSGSTNHETEQFVTAQSVPDLSPAEAPGPPAAKVCVLCGKDVTGRTRIKDSRGYICGACAQTEKQAAKSGPRCADCNRSVPASGLYDYEGLKICQFCRDDRVAAAKRERKFGGVKSKAYTEDQKKQLLLLVGALGVLLLIIVLHHFKLLGSFF